ncbi:UBX domain protein Ubx2 [Coemansia sp. RSA 2336]|nr:UBX domain protein Ubx2 [Coemansia sp. RSA 2336]
MDSEHVQNFCAVTGAEPDVATGYLQVSDNNVEQAVSLYFENGGQPLQSHGGAAQTASESVAMPDTDEVRAPIAARRDVLVDDYGSMGAYPSAYGGISRGPIRGSGAAASIFNQHVSAGQVPFRDFAQEALEMSTSSGSDSAVSSRRSRLAELFKPPFDIMHTGDLNSARDIAMVDGKWVLVNLQDVADFRCQALNRDIWSQTVIKEVVRKNFVFLQLSTDVPEGGRIATMYNAASYPFVAAIHPKTGELRTLFVRYENVSDMLEDLANFTADNPLSKKSQAASSKSNQAESSKSSRAGSSKRGGYSNVYNLSEEEQLAAAIAASELDNSAQAAENSESDYSDAGSYSDIQSISSGDEYYEDMDVDEVSEAHERLAAEYREASPPIEKDENSWYSDLPATDPLEPAAGPASTRIQFRFPNGQRAIRRFARTDSVRNIFQYLKATLPEAASEVPEVQFMSTRLADCIDQTIEEAKLTNASVVVDI